MRRNSHNRASSVRSQNVIRNPDWNLRSVYRINSVASCKDSCFVLVQVSALKVGFFCGLFNISFYCRFLFWSCEFLKHFVFRRHYHVSAAKKRVGSCCVYFQIFSASVSVFASDFKFNFRTARFSNPVFLHELYTFRPVKQIKIFKETFCVIGDF